MERHNPCPLGACCDLTYLVHSCLLEATAAAQVPFHDTCFSCERSNILLFLSSKTPFQSSRDSLKLPTCFCQAPKHSEGGSRGAARPRSPPGSGCRSLVTPITTRVPGPRDTLSQSSEGAKIPAHFLQVFCSQNRQGFILCYQISDV